MSVTTEDVRRIARLARIAEPTERLEALTQELNGILTWIEQLDEVDVSGVEPMTSVVSMEMKKCEDVVNDGNKAADIVANAPLTEDNFFMVPKVVE